MKREDFIKHLRLHGCAFLREGGNHTVYVNRREKRASTVNELLLDKLPEVLNEDQKMDKIHNLVSSLSGKRIRNIGGRRSSQWVLVEDDKQ